MPLTKHRQSFLSTLQEQILHFNILINTDVIQRSWPQFRRRSIIDNKCVYPTLVSHARQAAADWDREVYFKTSDIWAVYLIGYLTHSGPPCLPIRERAAGLGRLCWLPATQLLTVTSPKHYQPKSRGSPSICLPVSLPSPGSLPTSEIFLPAGCSPSFGSPGLCLSHVTVYMQKHKAWSAYSLAHAYSLMGGFRKCPFCLVQVLQEVRSSPHSWS